jgi:hypothetical protein
VAWHFVVKSTDVSEERTDSIFRVKGYAKKTTSKSQATNIAPIITCFLVYSLTLKMEAVRSSETLVNDRITRLRISEDSIL